jgi:hypothetical protein
VEVEVEVEVHEVRSMRSDEVRLQLDIVIGEVEMKVAFNRPSATRRCASSGYGL